MSWQFVDSQGAIVKRLTAAGLDSRLVSDPEVKAWVQAGNTITPADPPPPPTQTDLDTAAAKAYPKLQALASWTPAQVQTWCDANITDVASARDAIKTLAIAVGVLFRRL
jgi:hypothetical protein